MGANAGTIIDIICAKVDDEPVTEEAFIKVAREQQWFNPDWTTVIRTGRGEFLVVDEWPFEPNTIQNVEREVNGEDESWIERYYFLTLPRAAAITRATELVQKLQPTIVLLGHLMTLITEGE